MITYQIRIQEPNRASWKVLQSFSAYETDDFNPDIRKAFDKVVENRRECKVKLIKLTEEDIEAYNTPMIYS